MENSQLQQTGPIHIPKVIGCKGNWVLYNTFPLIQFCNTCSQCFFVCPSPIIILHLDTFRNTTNLSSLLKLWQEKHGTPPVFNPLKRYSTVGLLSLQRLLFWNFTVIQKLNPLVLPSGVSLLVGWLKLIQDHCLDHTKS